MTIFLWVCLGGAAGSGARYLLYLALPSKAFPVGTLAVNVIGSFLMGFLVQWSVRQQLQPALTVALASGVLGGFTTYSAFNLEMTHYFQTGAWRIGLLYMTLTLAGCGVAGFAGYALAMRPQP